MTQFALAAAMRPYVKLFSPLVLKLTTNVTRARFMMSPATPRAWRTLISRKG